MIKSCRNVFQRFGRYSVLGSVSAKEVGNFSCSSWCNSFCTWSRQHKDDPFSQKVYANFSIFKGKALLSLQPIPPQFSMKETGASFVSKGGSVMLTFMPAVGVRKYDSQRRQLFSLSATEVGCLMSLEPSESCEFFHDPSMKSSNQGQVKKTLHVSPMSGDGDFLFSLRVTNGPQNIEERFAVPVSKAEYAVLRASFSFILPHIIGWGHVASGTPISAPNTASKSTLEWNR